jgi:hypothetical protein
MDVRLLRHCLRRVSPKEKSSSTRRLVGIAALRRDGLRVPIYRDFVVRMAQQFLHRLDVLAIRFH